MTTLSRRTLLTHATIAGTAALAPWLPAHAQAIDNLKMFIPAAPGGGWDQTGRAMEQALKQAGLVKTLQFTNVGGAGGTVGLPQFVNRERGQANSLMVAGMVMVGAIIANKSAVSLSMVTPIARLTGEFEVVAVPTGSPIKTMADLVTKLKADPGTVSWGGGSAGGTDHILVGMIVQAAGLDPKKGNYVAYPGGGPALASLLGGHVTAGVSGWGEFAEQIKAGKLRALAISSDKRQTGIDAPTLKESGLDVELFNWRGVFAPPGVNAGAKAAMIDLVTKMAKSTAWQDILKNRDWTDIFLSGDAYGAYLAEENRRIEAILKGLGQIS
jgi:putative tricarboxylic transport membrane protein